MATQKKPFTWEQARVNEMKRTIIACITQKLPYVDLDQLSTVLAAAEQAMAKIKNFDKSFWGAVRGYYVFSPLKRLFFKTPRSASFHTANNKTTTYTTHKKKFPNNALCT